MTRRTGSRPRRGITLVEMMAAMATMTIVLGLCAAMLTMMLNVSESGVKHVNQEAAIARVARLFRQDVRSSREVGGLSPGGQASKVALMEGDRRIAYAPRGPAIHRVEWVADVMVQEETIPLPSGTSFRFSRPDETEGSLVALILARPGAKGKAPSRVRDLRIEAALGAARRFEPEAKGGER